MKQISSVLNMETALLRISPNVLICSVVPLFHFSALGTATSKVLMEK